jgi:hypothetical protein
MSLFVVVVVAVTASKLFALNAMRSLVFLCNRDFFGEKSEGPPRLFGLS